MERTNIDQKYTWDLSLLYQNQNDFDKDLNKAKDAMVDLINRKDLFLSSLEQFILFHEDYTSLSRLLSKLYLYAHLNCDVEPKNSDYQTMLSAISSLYEQMTSSFDFYHIMMIEHSEIVYQYLYENLCFFEQQKPIF